MSIYSSKRKEDDDSCWTSPSVAAECGGGDRDAEGGDFNNSLLREIVCDAFLRYLLLTALQPGIVKGKVHLNLVMLFFSEPITLFLHLVKGR